MIFRKLLTVPEYKDKFLRKLGDIFQTFTTDYMLSVLEPLVNQIEPEMQMHFSRCVRGNRSVYSLRRFPPLPRPDCATGGAVWSVCATPAARRPSTCLWGYIQDAFSLSDAQMLDYFGERPPQAE